jgi:hypothetical protein
MCFGDMSRGRRETDQAWRRTPNSLNAGLHKLIRERPADVLLRNYGIRLIGLATAWPLAVAKGKRTVPVH